MVFFAVLSRTGWIFFPDLRGLKPHFHGRQWVLPSTVWVLVEEKRSQIITRQPPGF